MQMRGQLMGIVAAATVVLAGLVVPARSQEPPGIYLIPNFHPACMGWLVRYSEERNYCLYSYLAHLDRVAKDPAYKFAFSELPHLITMLEFEPGRWDEFRQRVREDRVECVNAFVLEPTISLSGGEALVQQGVQGLRWYKQVMDVQPRFCWMIDTVGWHEQMAQIVAGLGLQAFVYCRYNPTAPQAGGHPSEGSFKGASAIHWIQSPDGTRALAINPGSYVNKDFVELFQSRTPFERDQLAKVIEQAKANRERVPPGFPVLVLGGQGDYALPFHYPNYPGELIAAWNAQAPDFPIRLATLSDYVEAVRPLLASNEQAVPTVTSGSGVYGWSSFWMNMPIVKQWYRRTEHGLQAAEMLSAIASLRGGMAYPSQEFANAWLLMALNMDRNVLWGVAVDGSFLDPESWDTRDRFEYVEARVAQANLAAFAGLTRADEGAVTLFNPVNHVRKGTYELHLPPGKALAGAVCQPLGDGQTILADLELPSVGLKTARLEWAEPAPPAKTKLADTIETSHYSARIDPKTGALVSLKLKPSGRELLSAPANVILAETKGDPHAVPERAARKRMAASNDFPCLTTITVGKLATIVETRGDFHAGGELRRTVCFYQDSPRIDFVTETNGLPAGTILSVEFPLADQVTRMRRGIPYGFSQGDVERGIPGVTGLTRGILPAIRWSDYAFKSGGGLALLDRGVPARELVGNSVILLLHNVCDAYFEHPVRWMADRDQQTYCYAIVPYAEDRTAADIPRMAWEYNSPVVVAMRAAVPQPESYVETSDNVVVEAMRRIEQEIELRLVECSGQAGQASISVHLPHTEAALTDLLGQNRRSLPPGPRYTFDVRPQQIVTLRLRAAESVRPVQALRSFDPVVPPAKREFMHKSRNPSLIGHPPRTLRASASQHAN